MNKYYIIGIKGAGLSALALILNDLGHEVIGYDDNKEFQFTETKLNERGIKINMNDGIDSESIVIRSTAIPLTHPKVVQAMEKNLKIYEYHEMVGMITKEMETITIAGCHGKTTTTSIMSHVLNNIIGVNYIIGDGTGYSSTDNKMFVLEACEYHRHFLNYFPKYAIITNIELDHVDYFKDLNDVMDAYNEYANLASNLVIACGDDENTRNLKTKNKVVFYGINDDNDIVAKEIKYQENGISFKAFIEGKEYGDFFIPVYGQHMLLNTLAVIAVCYYEKIDANDVQKELLTFGGAKRRFVENIFGNIITIDDYAHHPTEINALLSGVKQKYPSKKIIAVFEPHTFSRTNMFYKEFAESLKTADKSYVLDVYPAREKQEDYPNVNANLIIDLLPNSEKIKLSEVDKLLKHENSVIIFMSPKKIARLQEELESKLIN